MGVTSPSPDVRFGTAGSSGKLLPMITVRVVKPDGTLAARGELGELVVKGPNNALGYLNEEKAWVLTTSVLISVANERLQ